MEPLEYFEKIKNLYIIIIDWMERENLDDHATFIQYILDSIDTEDPTEVKRLFQIIIADKQIFTRKSNFC